jgi:hypothetical protein
MRTVTVLGLGVFGLFFALPAQALTIWNTDPDPHTVTIKTGSDSTELIIEPETTVEPPCQPGCTVELENGEQYEMSGNEEVSIEGGAIFVDTFPGSEDAAAGAAEVDPGDPLDAEPQDSAADHSEADAQAQ